MTAPKEKPRDDTDTLIEALHQMTLTGDLILPQPLNVNGLVHPAGRYKLNWVGDVPCQLKSGLPSPRS